MDGFQENIITNFKNDPSTRKVVCNFYVEKLSALHNVCEHFKETNQGIKDCDDMQDDYAYLTKNFYG